MSDIQDAYFADQERQIRRRYDPSICLFFNPRIDRWIVCEDQRIAFKVKDPLTERDPDLEGVPGIGAMTHYKALLKCECSDGKPFPPLADLVIKILAIQFPKNGDKSAKGVAKRQVERDEGRGKKFIREQMRRVYEDVLPLAMHRTRFLPIQGPVTSTLFKPKKKRG